ncbi:hypothetical protein HNR00_004990 [Methylorubrum rhodinum]|uniref:Uncharacterized protein n=1 Tax=Methylorubrum rhodinum TaxID=29428 RepID=A0A840ZTR5_9HYPH|nr:hypothetical protein [Methylorubrum rhodinum]MBB5760241.1 hypothetical protein [Methylorubrum rhodinum]
MPGPEDRLKASGQHVAIVGAFSVADDESGRVKTVRFRDAPAAIEFGLRAQRIEETISGIHPFMSLRISTPAEPVDGDSTKLPISGTALERELLKITGNPAPEEIGGKIVMDLMRGLDEQAPFWDPSFDVLLTEAYYFSRMFRRSAGEKVGGVDLHELIYEPGFNRLLTAYLRAPGEDAAAILELTRDAFPGDAFRRGTAPPELVKLRDDLLDHLRTLRAWLNQATDGDRFVVLQKDAAKGADARIAGEFDQKLRNLPIHGHRGKSLKEIYAVYREARDVVTQIARSEPLMAFVTAWYFSAFSSSPDPREKAKAILQTLYVDKGWKPTNIDAALEKELFELHAQKLRQLHSQRFGASEKPAARASANLIEATISEWVRLRKPGRVFRTDELIKEMGRLFLQLSDKFIPGMKQIRELIDEAMKLILKAEREVDANFTVVPEDADKPVDATAVLLEDRLMPVFASLDRTFAEMQAEKSVKEPVVLGLAETLQDVLSAAKDASGKALCEAVLKAVAARSTQVVSAVMEPIATNQKAIDERGGVLEKAVIAEWKTAFSSGGFVAAGAAGGISCPDVMEDDVGRRAESLPEVARLAVGQRVGLPLGFGTDPGKDGESPLASPNNPALSYSPSLGLTVNLPMTESELLAAVKEGEREAVSDALKPVWASMAQAQSDVLKAKRNIMDDEEFLNVAKAPQDAGRRALLRALIFGEHLLAAPEASSVLNKQDTSVFARILFECMRSVGARSEFERDGRSALERPSVDKDPGFADVPIKDVLQIKSIEDGTASIGRFLAYVDGEAQRVLALRDYLADMKDVKTLAEELSRSGDGVLTIVNATIDARGEMDPIEIEAIYESPLEGAVPPPAVVYVTRQAFAGGSGSLAPLERKLFEKENAPLRRGPGGQTRLQEVAPYSQLGFPLYVGRQLEAARLPSIVADVDMAGTLVLALCGIKRPTGALEGAWQELQRVTGTPASPKDSHPEFWRRFLSSARIEPQLWCKLTAHAIATRQMEHKAPEFRRSLVAAIQAVASAVDGNDGAGLRSRTWYVHDSRWKLVPPGVAAMPVDAPKVFLVTKDKPSDGALPNAQDDLFDLI